MILDGMAKGLCVKIKHVAKRHKQNNLKGKRFSRKVVDNVEW
jgi:hypothetical protein